MIEFTLIVLVAVIAGTMSGLLGIGGNMISIPLLLIIFKHFLSIPEQTAMHMAVCSGVIVMAFTTFSGTLTHYKKGNIDWAFFKGITPYMIVGVIFGAQCILLINGKILEKIFGAFLLFVTLKLIHSKISKKSKAHDGGIKILNKSFSIFIGVIIGFKSGLLGIGGGTIIIPLMLYLNYQGAKISGTTSACSFTMGLMSAITLILLNHNVDLGIKYSYGNLYLPAILLMIPITMFFAKVGATLSIKFSHRLLTNIQLICVGILAVNMLV